MNGAAIRIMLVDDHAVVRAGFRRLLEQEQSIRVVAETDRRSGHAFSSSKRRISVDFPQPLGPDTMMRGAIFQYCKLQSLTRRVSKGLRAFA